MKNVASLEWYKTFQFLQTATALAGVRILSAGGSALASADPPLPPPVLRLSPSLWYFLPSNASALQLVL